MIDYVTYSCLFSELLIITSYIMSVVRDGAEGEDTGRNIEQHFLSQGQHGEQVLHLKDTRTDWQPVRDSGIPGWDKDLLSEESESSGPPSIVLPWVDISLVRYVAEFQRCEESELPKITDLSASKEETRRRVIQDDEKVVLYNSGCFIRTTKAAIIKARRDREEEERMFRDGGRHFDRGGS